MDREVPYEPQPQRTNNFPDLGISTTSQPQFCRFADLSHKPKLACGWNASWNESSIVPVVTNYSRFPRPKKKPVIFFGVAGIQSGVRFVPAFGHADENFFDVKKLGRESRRGAQPGNLPGLYRKLPKSAGTICLPYEQASEAWPCRFF